MATAHMKDGRVVKYNITIKKLMKVLYNREYGFNLIKWGDIEYRDQFIPATAKILNVKEDEIERAYL